jgi:energy-coupling factor transporter transmembrane protein EcfT
MSDVPLLGYRAGTSPVHRLDVRLKLVLTAAATAVAAAAGPPALLALLAVTAALYGVAGLAPQRSTLKAVAPLALIVVAGRALSGPVPAGWLFISPAGVLAGLLYALRLAEMALLGALLAHTTTATALRAAIAWLLRPLPASVGLRAATMAGLVMSSLPVLARQAAEVQAARAARLAERAPRVTERILSLVRPVLRKTLLRADTLAAAMEARCYRESGSPPPLGAPRAWEWAAFASALLVMASVALLTAAFHGAAAAAAAARSR